MPTQQPPNNNGGEASQVPPGRDHFTQFVNDNSYVPMWLHPDVARGVLRHHGRDGTALVHPHPASGHPAYAAGGVVDPGARAAGVQMADRRGATDTQAVASAATRMNPPAVADMQGAPLNGIPRPGPRSIFGGGRMGAAGPTDRTPIFAENGAALDGTGGVGKVPGVDLGHDSVHALLEPGEAVFNQKQLKGIKVKPGKEHLVRPDQKAAMRKASGRARRK